MSERFIKNVSLSINTEKSFISKLKQEIGFSYVNKMTDMINDLENNKNELEAYKTYPSKGAPNGIKLNVQIISQSAWAIDKIVMEKIEMPKFMTSCLEDFENFYLKRHDSRKLMRCLGLSKLEVQFLYLRNKNIAISTLPQYLTLLQLEIYGSKTIREIAELLGCKVSIVLADIHGLLLHPSFNPQAQPEKGVIIGSDNPQIKEFKETDAISINKDFSVARQRFFTLPLAVKKSAAEIGDIELKEAEINKKYQDNILQSTLTRIMKSRVGQETNHIWLISEAAKQNDLFKAQPQQIKENIEKLIEKNIIKRLDKNKSCYEYIA
jgi:DNA-binding MarR family transcriptional regulator